MPDILRPSSDGSKQTIGLAVRGSTAHRSTGGAANQAATVSFAADSDRGLIIGQLLWSYSGAPTGGRLTVASGSDTLLDIDIAASGPGVLPLDPPILCGKSEAVTITLAAAGGGVTGKVNCSVWKM